MRFLFMALLAAVAIPAAAGDPPIRPDPALTPGAVLTTDASTVCRPGYAASVRHVAESTKAQVFAEYGIDRAAGRFEIDHLISLELGGSNEIGNLWPQSYESQPWNAHLKDRLEDRLHALVCAGRLALPDAQAALRTDWIAAYGRWLPPD